MKGLFKLKYGLKGSILLILFVIGTARGGVSGKIAGRIIEAGSGEPVPYVNVYLEDTSLGATTGEDGYYVMLNVPPGTYTLTAYAVGYQKVSYQNVKVSIDLTTRINVTFNETVLESSETIVVEAEKPLITKDLTASTAVMRSEDIQALPVTEFKEILELQAGVIDGHVRGGRSGEVVYAIDGIPVTDTYDGSTVIDVNTNAIEEMQFVSGAFNAEYGRALSGYVNIATREVSNKLEYGFTTYMGDYASSNTQIFRGIDQINPLAIRNLEGFVSAPILKNKLSVFANVRYIYFDGWLHGREVFKPWDITVNQGPDLDVSDRYLFQKSGDGKIEPMNWNEKVYGHSKLVYKPFDNVKLQYNFLMDRVDYQDYDHDFAYNPDGDYQRHRRGYTNILGVTHILSNATFYQFNASWFSKKYFHYVYEDPNDPRYTHRDLLNQQPQEVPSFKTGGTKNQHFERQTQTLTAKFDITSQVTRRHQLKFGMDLSRHQLDFNEFWLIQEPGLPDPALSMNPYAAMHIPDIDDPYENLSINRYTHRPLEFSAYLQDKIEFDQLIVNAGLRFDAFDPDGHILSDPSDPDIYRPRKPQNEAKTLEKRRTYWYKDATAKYQFSPRLGISFPITDRGVFHFSYGHFFQIPNFELLYQNPGYKFPTGTGNVGLAGNPDLKPEQTINGEVGFSQGLTDHLSLDITGYFRDIRNLTGTRTDEIDMFGGSSSYSQLKNSDFGFVRGIVFTLDRRFYGSWSAKVDYTYQIAKGNASDPDATRLQRINGEEPEVQLIKLSFDQTHTVNASFAYFDRQHKWGFSLIGRYGSGMPYTPNQSINISKLLTNSEEKPSYYNIDLKTHKNITMGAFTFNLFARIYNIFDFENELDVYNDSGTADYTLSEYLYRQRNLPAVVNTLDEYYRRPYYYSEPRRIELGLSINFNQ